MALELLHQAPNATAETRHVLLLHGICVGAWVWEEHFMPYLARAGCSVWALSLRGHGNSSGREELSYASLNDYVQDLDWAVKQIGTPPIVVGHSMGGAIVQRWLREGGKARGAALLASVPPWGLAAAAMFMALSSPILYREILKICTFGIRNADESTLRWALFSDDFPDKEASSFVSRVQDESRLIGPELQGFVPLAPLNNTTPMLVMGGTIDRFVPVHEVQRTAAYYGVDPVIVSDLPHCLMLDTHWQQAADPLLEWIFSLPS